MLLHLRGVARGTFAGDVSRLSVGTIGGRAILVAALPILSRLYTPEDFAVLAVLLGVVATVGVVSCLRFDVAIPLADSDEAAADLLLLSLATAIVVAGCLAAVIVLFGALFADSIGMPGLAPLLPLVPLATLGMGAYGAMQYWTTRERRFGSIARTRLSQAVLGVSIMLAFGWLAIRPLGLVLGHIVNLGSGFIRLATDALRKDKSVLKTRSSGSMIATWKQYIEYPRYSVPEALANVAGVQVAIIVIAASSGDEAGHVFMAMQAVQAPMMLLGAAVGQVFASRVADEEGHGRLGPFTADTMGKLLRFCLPSVLLVAIAAPTAFPLVLGEAWFRTGALVPWFAPWIVLQFVSSPPSTVILLRGHHREMLILTIVGMVGRIGVTGAAGYLLGVEAVGPAFALANAGYYLTLLGLVARSARFRAQEVRTLLASLFTWPAVLTCAAGFAIVVLIRTFL
jgi:O-antigen/teichoic acid export membrane protein